MALARKLTRQSLEAAQALGARTAEAQALLLASLIAARVDNQEAVRCAVAAREIGDALGDDRLRAGALLALGRISAAVGDFNDALAQLEGALALSDDDELRCEILNMMGWTLRDLGDAERAIVVHEEAARLAEAEGCEFVAVVARGSVAAAHWDLGAKRMKAGLLDDLERSKKVHEHALQRAAAIDCTAVRLHLLVTYGATLVGLGQHDEAERVFAMHGSLADELRQPYSRVRAALWLARIHVGTGRLPEALGIVEDGIARGNALGAKLDTADLHEFASEIHAAGGRFDLALEHHRHFHELRGAAASGRAEERAKVLAVKLETATAVARAAREGARAEALARANNDLQAAAAALRSRATTDAMTGLCNRGELDQRLEALHSSARNTGESLWVAFVDLDHFKQINDRLSHAAGDEVLRTVGLLLRQQLRPQDLVGRYGGEEFLFVMCDVTQAQATTICERLRRSIEQADWSGVREGLRVTASFGLSDVGGEHDLKAGLGRADALLYAAKAAGRNRVCA
ncbi:MAG: hypothetical protein JWP97_4289 [Labilithrix sp.]|nr:hypothetical protein [Labilithrix sp.]